MNETKFISRGLNGVMRCRRKGDRRRQDRDNPMILLRIGFPRVTDGYVDLKLGWTCILAGLKLDSKSVSSLHLQRKRKQQQEAGKAGDQEGKMVKSAPAGRVMGAYFHSIGLNATC